MKKRIRIHGFIIFFAAALVVVFPRLFLRHGRTLGSLEGVTESLGIACILMGQLLRVSARGYKAEYSRGGHSLIQDGPYALVRNPMYFGIILIGFGIICMLFNWWAFGIFLAVFLIQYARLIRTEEKSLLENFPHEYAAYVKTTPRLLPSIKTVLTTDMRSYLPLKLSWLKKEIWPIAIVLLAAVLIESWEDVASEGWRVYASESLGIAVIMALFVAFGFYLSRKSNGDIRKKTT